MLHIRFRWNLGVEDHQGIGWREQSSELEVQRTRFFKVSSCWLIDHGQQIHTDTYDVLCSCCSHAIMVEYLLVVSFLRKHRNLPAEYIPFPHRARDKYLTAAFLLISTYKFQTALLFLIKQTTGRKKIYIESVHATQPISGQCLCPFNNLSNAQKRVVSLVVTYPLW